MSLNNNWRLEYISNMKKRGERILSIVEELKTSNTHDRNGIRTMLRSALINAENFVKESSSIVKNYAYYAKIEKYIEKAEAFLYREAKKSFSKSRKLK